jgi:hypothetical protein
VITDAVEEVGEVSLRIDAIELYGDMSFMGT